MYLLPWYQQKRWLLSFTWFYISFSTGACCSNRFIIFDNFYKWPNKQLFWEFRKIANKISDLEPHLGLNGLSKFSKSCFPQNLLSPLLNTLSHLILSKKSHFRQSCILRKCQMLRSSRPEVFCKKGILRNFARFTGKHLCQSLFFNKVAGLLIKLF